MMTRTLVGVTALLLAAPQAEAQVQEPDTFRLPEVVVTATRLRTPIAAAPGTVGVLTQEDLRARDIRFVADALRLVPGVAVMQTAGPGSQTSVFIRGGGSDYVQVLVDGIQVNEPGGAFNWAHLRAEDVERIEIVRGPASVLYGSDAVAGVVQIFTRAGGAPRLSAAITSARGPRHTGDGTYTTDAFDAALSGGTMLSRGGPRLDYGFSAAHLGSNGLYPRNSDYDNTSLAGRLQLADRSGDAAITARRGSNDFQYPTTGSGAIVEREQFATGETLSLALDAGYRPLSRLELRVLATSHTADGRTENPPSELDEASFWSTHEITRRKLDARLNGELPFGTVLTVGFEHQWQRAITAMESLGSFGPYTDETDEERKNTAGYAQLHGSPYRDVAVTLGARIDDNDAFGTFRTGRAALSWTPVAAARLHGSIGTAFKEPTFFQTYATGFTRGNPDLQPEQARSMEAGAEYVFGRGGFSLGATAFHQQFRNLVQYTAAPATQDAPNYHNIGGARSRGVELMAHGAHSGFAIGLSYTLTRTQVTEEGFGADVAFQQGRRLLRRPNHQAAGSLGYAATPTSRLLLDVRYVGERDDLDFTDPMQWAGIRTALPAHAIVDLGVEHAVLRRGGYAVDLNVRLRNALDSRHEEIFNFPTAGRVVQTGLRGTFGR
jgi:vitamin B12 transporter